MKSSKLVTSVMLHALFICYLYVLIKVILFKFGTIEISLLWHQLLQACEHPNLLLNRLQFVNFIPFRSISENIHRLANPHDFINLFGNIVIFMPYGLFIGVMSKNNHMSYFESFARSLSLTLSLECAQFIFSIGSFDVDDLILNVSGGMLGYAVIKIIKDLHPYQLSGSPK